MTVHLRGSLLLIAWCLVPIAIALVGMPDRARAAVQITNDASTFGFLLKPTGKPDEPSLGGFNYWISSRTGASDFKKNDQYLNVGDETDETTAIAADLGTVTNLSGTGFDFSITHTANKNVSFDLSNLGTGATSTLCWGIDCPTGSISTPTLDGQPPINNYNGLQIQVRAQEILGSSITIDNLTLTGLDIAPGSAALFDGVVTPFTPSTLPLDLPGRVGQWILGTDLVLLDWELAGRVTLVRPDAALSDRNKVRLAVDFVNDTRLPTIPVPAALPMSLTGLAFLGMFLRRRRSA